MSRGERRGEETRKMKRAVIKFEERIEVEEKMKQRQ